MKKWLQKKFINYIVKDLFNGLTEKDILVQTEDNGIMFKGKKLDNSDVASLYRDAENIKKSTMWKLLTNDAKYQANKRMFEKSNSVEDMMAGKLMLYSIEILDNTLRKLSK